MKKCSKDCPPACDYCRFYNYNGDENGVYLGKGYCVLYERKEDPGNGCKDFICFHYKDKDKRITIKWPKTLWKLWVRARNLKDERK